jgi:antitoxin component of RelBE/YafQ-DinJ toxin-antitoxin module
MAKKTNYLQVKISDGLKDSFEAMCKEREISMSDVVRDLVANSVRNWKRQNGKATEKD